MRNGGNTSATTANPIRKFLAVRDDPAAATAQALPNNVARAAQLATTTKLFWSNAQFMTGEKSVSGFHSSHPGSRSDRTNPPPWISRWRVEFHRSRRDPPISEACHGGQGNRPEYARLTGVGRS